jgi:cell cycle arrest protein BUB3
MERIKNVYVNFISNNKSFFFSSHQIFVFFRYPAGITSLAFSSEGNMLAIASSYNYEYGADTQLAPNDITKNNIFVRRVSDLETKPK